MANKALDLSPPYFDPCPTAYTRPVAQLSWCAMARLASLKVQFLECRLPPALSHLTLRLGPVKRRVLCLHPHHNVPIGRAVMGALSVFEI
jgi:hypothetical protein